MNYRFNIDDWLPRFPLQQYLGGYSAWQVTSPWHICQNEQLRREMRNEYDWGPAVPMDVFIMADGEPADRHVTKIGGLPYRPAKADWPTRKGTPLVFLAQFNFCDSRDITGPLPGEVLLIFADEPYQPNHFHFEWQPLGLGDPAQVGATPGGSAFAPCFGHVCRVSSYPDWAIRDESSTQALCRGKNVQSEYLLPTYQATQIGPAPYFIQEGGPDANAGHVLCTISSVQPAPDVTHPWLNRPDPIPLSKRSADKHLMIGDMGCIYVFIDDATKLRASDSCY